MPLLGYGEDALTLHAFTSGLAELFRQFGDLTEPKDSIRVLRPSFGRRSSLPEAASAKAAFGEFDGIIGSAKAVYLIQAKWTQSGELPGAGLELRSEQRRRHVAFRTYLKEWRGSPSDSWEMFADQIKPFWQNEPTASLQLRREALWRGTWNTYFDASHPAAPKSLMFFCFPDHRRRKQCQRAVASSVSSHT